MRRNPGARLRARALAPRFRDRTMAVAAARWPWALPCLVVAALLFPGADGECTRVWWEGGSGRGGAWGGGRRATGGCGSPSVPFNNMAEGRLGRSRLPPRTPPVSEPGGVRGLLVPLLAERGGRGRGAGQMRRRRARTGGGEG